MSCSGWESKKTLVVLFALLLVAVLFVSCSSANQTSDGDNDVSVDGDLDQNISQDLQTCLDFCERKYECDNTGTFTEIEKQDCFELCENIDETCVGNTLLECHTSQRCDEFNTCVLQTEFDSDCQFPIDGDVDAEGGLSARLEMPVSVNFGAVVLGQSSRKTLTIYNTGLNILEIYNVLVADNLDEFAVDYVQGTTLYVSPGKSKDIDIVYSPLDGGKDEAILLVYSNSLPDRVAEVALVSDYKGFANIALDKSELTFPDSSVGGTSEAKTIRISNVPGSASDNRLLTISDLVIKNESEGAFVFAASSPRPPFVIVPDGYVEISLQFTPQTWGEANDTLTITSDSYLLEDQNLEVALSGTGAARKLCIVPDPISFGSVKVDAESTRKLEIEACGSTAVTVESIVFNGTAPFYVENMPQIDSEGIVMEPGEKIELDVIFRPVSIIGKTASIVIESNDLFFPTKEVLISGQGSVSNLILTPPFLSFGDVPLGSSQTLGMNLRNSGTWPLEITEVGFDAQENSLFVIEDYGNIFPLTLDAAGGEADIEVTFTPDVSDSLFDNLTFISDNSSGNLSAGLSGRGTKSEVSLVPNGSLVFENVQLGTTREVVLTVTNSGSAALNLSEYGIQSGSDVFSVSPETSETILQQNVTKDITVIFEPTEVGESSGKLYLNTDATLEAQREILIDLYGVATNPVLSISELSPYDFGQVLLGGQVGPVAITLTNSGSGALLIYSVKHDVAFDEAFTMVVPETNFPVILRPEADTGDQLTIYVSFAPAAEVNYQGSITLETDDVDSLNYTFEFKGRGGKCPAGFYDYDDNPNDCEYECHNDPSSVEICNNIDDNCDGTTDEGYNAGQLCGGVGVCPDGIYECDENDSSQTICSTNPGGSDYVNNNEICNNLDDDCDGQTDEDYFVGDECDGQGLCGLGQIECKGATETRCSTERGGSLDESTDEICDTLDNDCDGLTDEDYGTGVSCSGVGACDNGTWECASETEVICSTLPGGSEYPQVPPEELCDRQDNDCDGLTDEEWEIGSACLGDGQCGLGFWECDSINSRKCSTNPGGSEYPSPKPEDLCDGIDNDCDGFTDEDYLYDVISVNCQSNSDCDAGYSCDIHSGDCISDAVELCDGVGECGGGTLECRSTRVVRCSTDPGGSEHPTDLLLESCDGKDNDCDGFTDEIFGLGAVCDGVGECGAGVIECDGANNTRCSTDLGGSQHDDPVVGAKDEVCDSMDNDCDGATDEGYSIGNYCNGVGECGDGSRQCDPNDTSAVICSTDPLGYSPEDQPEVCDGLDNDCDGNTDEVCRVNIYRHVKEYISGSDYEYRLSTSSTPPAGFQLDSVQAVFSLYDSMQTSTSAFVELLNPANTDTTYSADSAEIDALVMDGWTQSVTLGYAATVDTGTDFYRVYKSDISAHNFTADELEYLEFFNAGYQTDFPANSVWVYPAINE